MDPPFLLLQFLRLSVGGLLRFFAQASSDRPRLFIRAYPADLRQRRFNHPFSHHSGQIFCSLSLYLRITRRDLVGIHHRLGDGKIIQSPLLGL